MKLTWCWWCKDCASFDGGRKRRDMRKNAKTHSRLHKHTTRFGSVEDAKVYETFSLGSKK